MDIGGRAFDFRRQVAVMAVVNRTPDSFYDRGRTFALGEALTHALQQVAEGADLLDIGGVKAGPGEEVDATQELERVIPLVEALRVRTDTPLSVDTWRPAVARAALDAGATMVNDASGLVEPELADVVAAHPDAVLVVMHAGGRPAPARTGRATTRT